MRTAAQWQRNRQLRRTAPFLVARQERLQALGDCIAGWSQGELRDSLAFYLPRVKGIAAEFANYDACDGDAEIVNAFAERLESALGQAAPHSEASLRRLHQQLLAILHECKDAVEAAFDEPGAAEGLWTAPRTRHGGAFPWSETDSLDGLARRWAMLTYVGDETMVHSFQQLQEVVRKVPDQRAFTALVDLIARKQGDVRTPSWSRARRARALVEVDELVDQAHLLLDKLERRGR